MLIGGAIGVHSKNIYRAFFFGFLSHYVLDMIPHWEYLSSLNEVLIPINVFKILIDFGLGLLIVFLILRFFSKKMSLIVLVGMGASILPDALQMIIYFLKLNWLMPLFNFHQWVHSPIDLTLWPGLLVMVFVFISGILIFKI